MYSSRTYPCFDVVEGLVWSNDPVSYAGSSVATGRVSLAGQVKGDDLDKNGYTGAPGCGLYVEVEIPPHKNVLLRIVF